jgi:hypothetical protein
MRSHSVWSNTPSFNVRSETDSNTGVLEHHSTPENASAGKETPRRRVSFDSDHGSLPAMHKGTILSKLGIYPSNSQYL